MMYTICTILCALLYTVNLSSLCVTATPKLTASTFVRLFFGGAAMTSTALGCRMTYNTMAVRG